MESVIHTIGGAVERVAFALGKVFRTNLPAYIDLETSDGPNTLVTSSGAIVSGLRILGTKSAFGSDEFERAIGLISQTLSNTLTNSARTVDIFMSADPEAAARSLMAQAARLKKQSEAIGLAAEDVIDSNAAAMAKHASAEEVYLVLWTRPTILAPTERREAYKDLEAIAAKAPPVHRSAQDPVSSIPSVREAHESTLISLKEQLRAADIATEVLTAHEMVTIAKRQLYPDETAETWSPLLPGDSIPTITSIGLMRDAASQQLDYSDILAPSLARQMVAGDAERVSRKSVRLGQRLYAPVLVDVPPKDLVPFNTLHERLAAARIPWRCMFRLDGGGLQFLGTKSMVSRTFAFGSKVNTRIADAIEKLEEAEVAGGTTVRLRVAFCTWARAGEEELLMRRAARLASAVSAWGDTSAVDVSGDVMAGVISTVPFASETHIGNSGAGRVEQILRIAPLFRPASPWKIGAMAFRTKDGKLIPFDPGSSLQASSNYTFIGRPGFGKSVQMLNLLLSVCLRMGARTLPRVSILDIGPSSSYFIEMLKGSLQPTQRHLVQAFKLKATPEHSINIFDLPLGARFPTSEHKAFLVNVLSQIATPAEAAAPYMRMSEMVSAVIDDAYAYFSDSGARSRPKIYAYGVEASVDQLLERYGITEETARRMTWYQVVDYLAERGHTREATLAQRNAVPLLSDLTSLSQSVIDIYGKIEVDGRQTLADAFQSLIQAALKDFPNLSAPTQFDIGEARVVAIDLSEVAKSDSSAGVRQTAIMYMVATYAISNDYRFDEQLVEDMKLPPVYHRYHMKRVASTKEEIKWMVFDEFHRTQRSPMVVAMVERDQREGRKFGIGVVLSSQHIKDYPEVMRALQTGFFIVDHGGSENLHLIKEMLGLNETAVELLEQEVTGPKQTGAPMLVKLTTKSGDFTQLLISTMGPAALWGLSTTMEDAVVRKRVCERLGSVAGRNALAELYPGGGVKDVVEALKSEGVQDAYAEVVSTILGRISARTAILDAHQS